MCIIPVIPVSAASSHGLIPHVYLRVLFCLLQRFHGIRAHLHPARSHLHPHLKFFKDTISKGIISDLEVLNGGWGGWRRDSSTHRTLFLLQFLFVIITCLCQVMVLSLRVRLSSFWTISHWCQAPQARTPSTYPLGK